MKCPFKMGRYDFEGGEECDSECAWLVKVYEASAEPLTVCAMTLMGSPMECPRMALNKMEDHG